MARDHSLEQQALKVLHQNSHLSFYQDTLQRHILPSRHYYTHQWFWDSCMHAMGLAYYDMKWAQDEIASLFHGQWDNGFIGHIIFNTSDTTYYPGIDVWGTKQLSPRNVYTSGIIQPPLLAISMNHMDLLSSKNDNFIDTYLPKLMLYHTYLKTVRDKEDSGLLTIIHPWESGTDNSPRWDSILSRINVANIPERVKKDVDQNRKDTKNGKISHRPQRNDYYRYLYLVDMYKNLKWNSDAILEKTPFAIKDTLVNSMWAKANQALSDMLTRRNRLPEAQLFANWARETRSAMRKSWNNKKHLYALYDVSYGKHQAIDTDTVSNFMPLYAHIPTPEHLSALLKKLTDPTQYGSVNPVPSVPLTSPSFEPTRYWRGPTWPITNLFIIEGLKTYTKNAVCQTLAKKLLRKTEAMIEKKGFYEYYHPFASKKESGVGFGDFSWSAAIYLYLKKRYTIQDDQTDSVRNSHQAFKKSQSS